MAAPTEPVSINVSEDNWAGTVAYWDEDGNPVTVDQIAGSNPNNTITSTTDAPGVYDQKNTGWTVAEDGADASVYINGIGYAYSDPNAVEEEEAPTEVGDPNANGGSTGTPGLPNSDTGTGTGGTTVDTTVAPNTGGGTQQGAVANINGTDISPATSPNAYTSTTTTYQMPSESLRKRLDEQKARNAQRRQQTNRGLGAAMGAATGGQSSNTMDVLDEFLSEDNRVMQRAETEALQTANERGLLNSSMAVGAATGAVVDAAEPYVLQESGQRADKERAAQDWTYQSSLSEQDFEQGSQQQAQAYEESYSLQNLENASRIDLAMIDRDTRVRLQEMADSQAMAIAELEISSENINFAVDAANAAQDRYNDTVRQIMDSETMSAEEKAAAIEEAGNGMLATFSYLESIYNIDLDWSNGQYSDAVV